MSDHTSNRRLIEDFFPVKEVSKASAREKNIHAGHISSLHIWWARRPLSASRATAYSALVPVPANLEERKYQRDLIIRLAQWEETNNNQLMEEARRNILKANNGIPPKVLDPFSGGGSIPLELHRLGCDTHASDLNPVAVLLEKCTIEYPHKYGQPDENGENRLYHDVKEWGEKVIEEAKKQLDDLYPKEEDGSIPVAYIWARTIPCQNPSCGVEIPLMRQYWLSSKTNKKVALYPIPGKIELVLVGDGYDPMPLDFDPDKGSVARANVVCPACGCVIKDKVTRSLFFNGKGGQKMVAVVTKHPTSSGKKYRLATPADIEAYFEAKKRLDQAIPLYRKEWGVEPIPDESLPPRGTLGFRVQGYGLQTWGDLFNSRQKLVLLTFVDLVRNKYREMIDRGIESEYGDAIATYLGLLVDRIADFQAVLCQWRNNTESINHVYSRNAMPFLWDYAEGNIFSGLTGSVDSQLEQILATLRNSKNCSGSSLAIRQGSATSPNWEANSYDAVFTDPPYYDNVPYSYLSDFFYVWATRTLQHIHPYLFESLLTPKKEEIVAYGDQGGGLAEGKVFFEREMRRALTNIHNILKPNGLLTLVYAHKSTSGWETLINSLIDSGLIVTASYPLDTESSSALSAQGRARLASSIYIIARKMVREPVGYYSKVKQEMKTHLNSKLTALWEEGVGGADFFIAAIGSGIEIFGKYEKVMDMEGNTISTLQLLEDIRQNVTDYAVRQILHNGFADDINNLSRFYVLYRWNYGEAKLEFDEANNLARVCGINLSEEWGLKSFVKQEKEFIRVIGPHERSMEELEGSSELIDVLHLALKYWERSDRNALVELLANSGYGKREAFYRVAQAVSECLTLESREKKLLDGFLSGSKRLIDEIRERPEQTGLNL